MSDTLRAVRQYLRIADQPVRSLGQCAVGYRYRRHLSRNAGYRLLHRTPLYLVKEHTP